MSVTTERKIASAGMAAAMLGSLAALLFVCGLVLGLGAPNDSDPYPVMTGERG
jgi:hypothetical protein